MLKLQSNIALLSMGVAQALTLQQYTSCGNTLYYDDKASYSNIVSSPLECGDWAMSEIEISGFYDSKMCIEFDSESNTCTYTRGFSFASWPEETRACEAIAPHANIYSA